MGPKRGVTPNGASPLAYINMTVRAQKKVSLQFFLARPTREPLFSDTLVTPGFLIICSFLWAPFWLFFLVDFFSLFSFLFLVFCSLCFFLRN